MAPEALAPNWRIAFVTGHARSAVDPEPARVVLLATRNALAAAKILLEELRRGFEAGRDLCVTRVAQGLRWRDAVHEHDFRLVDVAYAGGDALIEQRVDKKVVAIVELAGATNKFDGRYIVGNQVGAKARIEDAIANTRRIDELDFLRVEADPALVSSVENDRRLSLRALPGFLGTVDVPGAVHAKVASNARSVVEVDEEVLATRLDLLNARAAYLGQWLARANSRVVQGLAGQSRRHERRDLVNRVALRHGACRCRAS